MKDAIISALSPMVVELVGALVFGLVGYIVKLVRDKTGYEIEAKCRDALHMALDTGAQLALAKLGLGAKPTDLRAEMLAYARQSVPDAIKRLKPTGSVLNDLATAKLQSLIGGK